MSYRKVGVVGKHYDDHKNLLKRQLAAAEYIKLLKSGREVINVDESIIRSTDQRARGWVRQGKRVFVSNALRLPHISMIGAISSKGKTFFTVSQGNNTSLTFSLFLLNLIQELDSLDPDWRKTTTILLDNTSIHCAKTTKENFEAFGLPIMFLAPYSFKMDAVEKLFSFVKNRDLNPLVARAYSR
jgi:transposase